MKTIQKIDAVMCKLFKVLTQAAGIIGALMMVLSVTNVIARSIFNSPIFGTVEIISYSALLLGAFALALNELADGNITMTLLTDTLKPKPKNAMELVTSILAAAFYAIITYRFADEIFRTMAKATSTTTLHIPMWIVNVIMTIGFFAATFALLLKALRAAAYLIYGEAYQKGGNGK